MYFVIFSDYGFNLAGTKEISVNRTDDGKLSGIFSAVLTVKLLIGIICLLVISILILTLHIFKVNWILYLMGTGIIFGSVLFPQWFFQGIEKMEIIPVINIPVKVFQVILIFLIVRQEADYILYLVILAAAQLLIGILGLIIAIYFVKVKPQLPSINEMKEQFTNGFKFFPLNIGVNIFNNSGVFIVGLLAGEYAAGIFSAADKIRLSLQGILSSLTMSVYPHAVKIINGSKQKFILFIRNIFNLALIIGIVLGLILFLFSGEIILLLLGPGFKESIFILKLFSIVILFFSASEVLCYLILLPSGFDILINRIIVFSALFHVVLLLILTDFFNYPGGVYSIIITQFIIMSAAGLSIKNKNLMKL
jgi:PST family polysaccharide transporter